MEREQVEYDNRLWFRYPNAKTRTERVYFQSGKKRLHIYIYEKYYGTIPKGFHVHHIDGNPANNTPENLEAKDRAKHQRDHVLANPIYKSEKALLHLAKIRLLTVSWHKSPEGIEWHRNQSKKIWATREPKKSKCEICNKEYQTLKAYGAKFCSNNCKSKHRRSLKKDHCTYTCQMCKVEFQNNKYIPRKFCSRACSAIAIGILKKLK